MYGHGKFGGVKLGAKEREEEPGRFRRPRKISYLLRHPDFDKRHVGGVNACALAPACGGTNGAQLYTAGRDGTVRAWSLDALAEGFNSKRKGGPSSGPGLADECVEAWEGHSSWVNDVAHLRTTHGNFLLSASSDSSVKVWSIDSPADSHRCVASLTRHGDYVMKLATSGATSGGGGASTRFASAGLGECDNLFLWDAERATAVVDFASGGSRADGARPGASGVPPSTDLVVDAEGQKESAYALALDDAGNTLVSGCTGNVVRVWDGRTGARICKLRGHSGNVRCAALSGDGRLCLTGSSDHTLRLWDLGQQRCVQTVHGTHHCSVWSVAMDASWHVCYSGGADGGVYATDLAHRRSAMLFEEEKGVLSLTLDDSVGAEGVWAATMGCGIRRWRCDVDWRNDEHAFTPGQRGGPGHRLGSGSYKDSPMSVSPKLTPGRASARTSNAWGGKNARAGADPIHASPTATIESTPPIVEHVQTSDRLRILAADADGAVSLWDVIKCERVRCFERGTSLASAAKETNPRVSVPSWFTVDTRSGSIAISLMPSGAFQAEAYAVDFGVAEANDELKLNYGVQCVHMLLRDWKARRVRAIACENGRAPDSSDDDLNDSDSNDFDVNSLPPCGDARVWRLPSRPPSLVCEQPEGEGGAVLMPVGEMVGSAEEQDALPEWIVDVVAERHRVPDSAKASFHLAPHESQPDAPRLSQGRVTAPRVLGVRKVVNYVVQKLGLDGAAPEDLVDILCGGEVCDPAMSLATVKEFLWRKGSDVELVYRFKDGVDYGGGDGGGGGGVATA